MGVPSLGLGLGLGLARVTATRCARAVLSGRWYGPGAGVQSHSLRTGRSFRGAGLAAACCRVQSHSLRMAFLSGSGLRDMTPGVTATRCAWGGPLWALVRAGCWGSEPLAAHGTSFLSACFGWCVRVTATHYALILLSNCEIAVTDGYSHSLRTTRPLSRELVAYLQHEYSLCDNGVQRCLPSLTCRR